MLRTERLADETLWFTLNLEAWHAFAIWNREKPRVLFDEIPYFLDDEFSTLRSEDDKHYVEDDLSSKTWVIDRNLAAQLEKEGHLYVEPTGVDADPNSYFPETYRLVKALLDSVPPHKRQTVRRDIARALLDEGAPV